MHDQAAVRTEGISDLLTRYPQVKATVDAGYRGLARQFPDQVQAPPLKPGKDAAPEETAAYQAQRHQQSPNGSASSTRTPNSSSGTPSSDSPDDATNSRRPSWRSPRWSPTAPPNGNPRQSTRQASTSQR